MPVEDGAKHLAVLRIEERRALCIGKPRERLVGGDEERPVAVRLGLRPILVCAARLDGGDEGREASIGNRAQRLDEIDGRGLLHGDPHRVFGARRLRKHHAVDHMDHAVRAADVAVDDPRLAIADPASVGCERLAAAAGGARHLRVLDVRDLHRHKAARHDMVREDRAQLVLVLRKQERLERSLRQRSEGFVGRREDGERAAGLKRVGEVGRVDRSDERLELRVGRGIDDVLGCGRCGARSGCSADRADLNLKWGGRESGRGEQDRCRQRERVREDLHGGVLAWTIGLSAAPPMSAQSSSRQATETAPISHCGVGRILTQKEITAPASKNGTRHPNGWLNGRVRAHGQGERGPQPAENLLEDRSRSREAPSNLDGSTEPTRTRSPDRSRAHAGAGSAG